jgi:hypothetical protein
VRISTTPFAPLPTSTERAFGVAARRYGRFLGLPVEDQAAAAAHAARQRT